MNIKNNLDYVNQRIAVALLRRREFFMGRGEADFNIDGKITIAAASKYIGADSIVEAYHAGLCVFGENKIQDLKSKYSEIKDSHPEIFSKLKFHAIGHLQTNKVRDAVSCSEMIQSVDSIKLARVINEQCVKLDKNIGVLIEVKTSGDDLKSGIAPDEAISLAGEIMKLERLELCGVMTMASLTGDEKIVKGCFTRAYEVFIELRKRYDQRCRFLSMGMTDDFELAVECGANIIRLGRILFK